MLLWKQVRKWAGEVHGDRPCGRSLFLLEGCCVFQEVTPSSIHTAPALAFPPSLDVTKAEEPVPSLGIC